LSSSGKKQDENWGRRKFDRGIRKDPSTLGCVEKSSQPWRVPLRLANKIVWEQCVRGGFFVEDGRRNYVEECCESSHSCCCSNYSGVERGILQRLYRHALASSAFFGLSSCDFMHVLTGDGNPALQLFWPGEARLLGDWWLGVCRQWREGLLCVQDSSLHHESRGSYCGSAERSSLVSSLLRPCPGLRSTSISSFPATKMMEEWSVWRSLYAELCEKCRDRFARKDPGANGNKK
jgi:hypothetical protein